MKRTLLLCITIIIITALMNSNVYSKNVTLPTSVTNEGTPIKGGILKVGIVKDEPLQGVFLAELYENRYDAPL